ncbi:Protein kinase, putative [Hondaea fermentalgiana]|uniref:Cyclin-dependent kinase 2 homolog n=1 Tax=Hondaea fermentalgiana TaxID=2315210 RepID=A0A2R5GQU8_9STRA|nr:Protein kinase, putative [Hondaea fermentalgiana]|eukprot:GBG32975.1 Protein kinase, putative [Hondaea fermentalgiana]
MGVFGHVFAARDRVSGTISALKRIRNGPEHIRKVQAAMLRREMELLLECNHQNIVSLQAIAIEPIEEESDWAAQDPFVTQPSTTFLVLECLETDLRELSRSEEDGLDLRSALGATRQVASALEYIHARRIMHRDVKAANILYDCNEQRAVLCDFGMARRIDTDAEAGHLRTYTPDCTTLHYRAPEMLFGTRPGNYNATVDLWGLGCVLAEILLGETFLYGDDWTTQVQALLRVFGRPEQAEIDHLTRSSRINDVLIGTITQSCSARAANLERTLVARAQRIGKVLPPIANEVFELLAGLLNPNPQQRFTAAVACTAATASEQGQARADQ